MTEPVRSVSRAAALDKHKATRERLWQGPWHDADAAPEEQDDTVQISEEARQRASGKIRKNILEHLAEDDAAGIR